MLRAGLWHRGLTRLFSSETPPVGKEWKIQVPTTPEGVFWRVKSLTYVMTTSAAVANRRAGLLFSATDEGGGGERSYLRTGCDANIIAASAVVVCAAEGGELSVLNSPQQNMTLPIDLRIPPGHYVRSSTLALDPGDQLSAATLMVEEWLYEPPAERSSNIGDASDANRVDVINLNRTMERIAQLLEAQQATP